MTIITTMKGKKIDVGAIFAAQGDTIAIGNANMNAKGDIIGAGGKVVKDAATITKEYNAHNPKAVKRVSLKELNPSELLSPADAMAEFKKLAEQAREVQEDAGSPMDIDPQDDVAVANASKTKRVLRNKE